MPKSTSALPGAIPSYLRGHEALYRENPRAAAVEWHRNAKWGLFIHYALYSLRRLTARDALKAKERSNAEWKELAHLCEIGGLTRQVELVEPVRNIFLRASGLGLKSAARKGLLNLGLTETEINRKPPVQTILVLEPSAFFRKRLASTLASKGGWQIQEAGNREEAETLLAASPVDLVISETHDANGDLSAWLEQQWDHGRCRAVLFSASSRDLGLLADASWVEGTLFKPYPMEQLLRAIEG